MDKTGNAIALFLIIVFALAILVMSVEAMGQKTKLNAIYSIAENNAHDNPMSWTIMDIIKGE